MKPKGFAILLLAVLLMALAVSGAGCNNSREDSVPHGQSSESTGQEANLETDDKSKPEKTKMEFGEITDPVELEKLWQEYLFDSSNLVGISRRFSSAEEIEPLYVAQFCWQKYINEHDAENLEPVHENSSRRIFPLDTALQYAKRYFNLDNLDVSKIDEHIYDPQRKSFLFSPSGKRQPPRPSYKGSLRGERLEKATRNSDGTITAVLAQPDYQVIDRIMYRDTYTLKQREEGSLYFVSGKREYINNHLVSISGEYQRFDKITGFDDGLDALSMLGETEGRLIFAYAPYEKGKNAALMLVNPETMSVEKKVEVNEKFEFTDVSLSGESIIIRLKDRFIAVDKNLVQQDTVSLPETIAEKIKREPQYNAKGTPDVFFGGYDVSSDRKRYVYADETGVKLFYPIDNSEKLLSKTISTTGSKLTDNSYHMNPRFVAGEQKVITTMTGYDGAEGYTLCDLESGAAKIHRITSECSSTGLIRYDTGVLEVNSRLYNQEKQIGECKTLYLDFRTGGVKEISLDDPGETGDIRMSDLCYVGRNHAAFITYKMNRSDNANNMYYLNRLNLKTFQIEPEIISIKAAQTHILGVLADGRIAFWYSLNPSENGICITK